MTDHHDKCEAMMHLETTLGILSELPMTYEPNDGGDYLIEFARRQQIERRIWAALYLVQSLQNGAKPDNFAEVMEKARWYDARNEAIDVINEARRGAT
jgi:hypothetical protein